MVDLATQWYWALAFGLFAGFSSSLLGIGGGVIMMPLLVLVAAMPNMDSARGTALGYMVGTCLVGMLSYKVLYKADVNLRIVLLLTAGGMVGAWLGAMVGTRISPVWVKRVFALLMVYAAWRMFMGTLPTRGEPEPASPEIPAAEAPESPG
jgi:uncharacterized membrane protein YfcA